MSVKVDKTVHVVGNLANYVAMFENHGWTPVDNVEDADLVQFCGGEDVHPLYYDKVCNKKSNYNLKRDRYEEKIFELAIKNKKAIAGICRGAQFVHVMNGGKLWQHVDKHAISGYHRVYLCTDLKCFDDSDLNSFFVTSTHHQQMRDNKGEVILAAWESTYKEDGMGVTEEDDAFTWDVEAVWHEDTRSFCYQPHPEHDFSHHMNQKFYFRAIRHLLFTTNYERTIKKEAS